MEFQHFIVTLRKILGVKMNKELKNNILVSLLIQFIVLIVLFLGWILGFLLEKIGLGVSPVIYILALVLFFFLKKYNYKVHIVTIVTSLATGVLIGSFISEYSKDIIIVLKVIGVVAVLVILIHGLLLLIPYHKTIIIIAIILLIAAIIVGFAKFDNVFSKELTLLEINYLFTLGGLLIFFIVGKDMDLYLAGSLLWAFIIIFIIIIVILSEGDALSGLDGADFGISGKKKKSKL